MVWMGGNRSLLQLSVATKSAVECFAEHWKTDCYSWCSCSYRVNQLQHSYLHCLRLHHSQVLLQLLCFPPMDQILQTPDETHLIKRGGNGSIYAASYSGFDFTVI